MKGSPGLDLRFLFAAAESSNCLQKGQLPQPEKATAMRSACGGKGRHSIRGGQPRADLPSLELIRCHGRSQTRDAAEVAKVVGAPQPNLQRCRADLPNTVGGMGPGAVVPTE